jgi:hypothetical protein
MHITRIYFLEIHFIEQAGVEVRIELYIREVLLSNLGRDIEENKSSAAGVGTFPIADHGKNYHFGENVDAAATKHAS